MWLAPLLWCLNSGSQRSRRDRERRPKRPQRHPLVPRLEALECRTLPSTFTVLTCFDDGPGSLRQAIRAANVNPGPDVIRFAPATRDGTITLNTGQLTITDDLTIWSRAPSESRRVGQPAMPEAWPRWWRGASRNFFRNLSAKSPGTVNLMMGPGGF